MLIRNFNKIYVVSLSNLGYNRFFIKLNIHKCIKLNLSSWNP